jgi:hypothetical protein
VILASCHSAGAQILSNIGYIQRRIAAMRLQEIEGNPLSADEIAMFEMFEREAWTHERRRAYLHAR